MAFITSLVSGVSKVRVWMARPSSCGWAVGTPAAQPAASAAAARRSSGRPRHPRMARSEAAGVIGEGLHSLVAAKLDGYRQRPLGGAGGSGGVAAAEDEHRAVVLAARVGGL